MKKIFTLLIMTLLVGINQVKATPDYYDFALNLASTTEPYYNGASLTNQGLAVASDGTVSLTDNADKALAFLTDTWHDSSHGCVGVILKVYVPGRTQITIGKCQYSNNGVATVTNETGEKVTDDLNIGGACYHNNTTENVATAVYSGEAGWITITCCQSSGTDYVPYIALTWLDNPIKEKKLYSTDFSDWTKMDASTEETVVKQSTKYSHEDINFTLYNTDVDPAGTNSKFNNGEPLGWLRAAKAEDPYVMTSTLASITKVRYVHAATGSKRGWKLEAKGDGDADWVTLSDAVADPAGWSEVNVDVNRTNVQLRWTNLNSTQNAYMFELDIYGKVDMSGTPSLGSIIVNDSTFEAADYCTEGDDYNYSGVIEISKKENMVSSSNPVGTIVASGEVGDITYEAVSNDTTKVTIPVSANGQTIYYYVNVVFKPDFTLTYIDVDGITVIGTQEVEKDQAIGNFKYDGTNATILDGYKFRGWAVSVEDKNQFKYTEDYIVTSDLTLYAMSTDIETVNDTSRYEFNLTSQYFFDEDHEGFNSIGSGYYHDNTHGWAFGATDTLKVLFCGTGYIKLGLCKYSAAGNIVITDPDGNMVDTCEAKVETDGYASVIKMKDLTAGEYTITFPGTCYMHNVTVANMINPTVRESDNWYIVKSGDADGLVTALELAAANNNTSDAERSFIFLPDGTYDLGEKCLTTISGYNISLIGQSMEGTIIMNKPTAEGIGVTATLLNTAYNLYMQDLTLKNDWDYTGATGRAVCFQDKGFNTICKNVKLLSYQDTYYSAPYTTTYWETSEIHGVVDYICGYGDTYFNECLLYNEDVNSKSATMTAPYTYGGEKWGYVFESCTVESPVKFNWGRSWGGESMLTYLNTYLYQPANIVDSRFTTAGMNTAAYDFNEYNTMDKEGNVISPASNILTFTLNGAEIYTYETILTADEAAAYSYDKLFNEGWDPKTLCVQEDAPTTEIKDGNFYFSYSVNDGPIAYALFKNGVYESMIWQKGLGESGFISLPYDETTAKYTVRAANSMGGFSPDEYSKTAINSVEADTEAEVVTTKYYNLSGMQTDANANGVIIKVNTYKDGSTKSFKITK